MVSLNCPSCRKRRFTSAWKGLSAREARSLRRLLRRLCWLDFHGPVTPQNICSAALHSPFRWQLSKELHLRWWQKVCSTDRHQCRLMAGIALGAVVVCPGTPQGINTSGNDLQLSTPRRENTTRAAPQQTWQKPCTKCKRAAVSVGEHSCCSQTEQRCEKQEASPSAILHRCLAWKKEEKEA